jgi:hypothetical protein
MTKYYSFKIIVLLVCLLSFQTIFSQQKGSFNVNIQFLGTSRMLSFYVPNSYDSTKQYNLMVCLHGMGQPANSYRDNLCPSWSSIMPNMIFVCPESIISQGVATADYFSGPGQETIIDSAIAYSKAHYSIDAKQIFLEGFSMGGRSALKYGLEYPDKFKGLLLNTPAVQGKMDQNNVKNYSIIYNYKNGAKIPIALTYGTADANYSNMGDTIAKILSDNNTPLFQVAVNNMGHAIPNNATIQQCMNFFNQPVKNGIDASIYGIFINDRIYDIKAKPLFRLVNYGLDTIISADIKYNINGTDAQYSWSGSLPTLEHKDIELPEITCQENSNTLSVTIVNLNGEPAVSSLAKKTGTVKFNCYTQALSLPNKTSFENNEQILNYWDIRISGGMWTWSLYNQNISTDGANSLYLYNMPFVNLNQGFSDNLLSPVMDLSSVNHPCLAFDLAFDYIYLTPPSYNNYYTFSDTLNILISVDSGKTNKKVYSKTYKDLATVSSPITNPASLDACIFAPQSIDDWRINEIIILDDYKTATHAYLTFQYVSGMGGTIWLDNIRFMSMDYLAVEEYLKERSGIIIAPNPAIDMINLNIPETASELNIYNLIGMKIYSKKLALGESEFHLSTNGFNSGTYIVEILVDGKIFKEKLMIVK